MVSIVVVTRAALLIARRASTWSVEEHLGGRSPQCVAVDRPGPTRVYCGTAHGGLFRSRDNGRTRNQLRESVEHPSLLPSWPLMEPFGASRIEVRQAKPIERNGRHTCTRSAPKVQMIRYLYACATQSPTD
jgi:hypothetical protein